MSAIGRDAVMDLVLKNVQENLSPGLAWTEQFIKYDGISKFLAAAVVQPADRLHVPSALLVTSETRVHAALGLQKVYDDLDSDRKRKLFTEKCEEFVKRILADPDPTNKIEAVLAIITLLQGMPDQHRGGIRFLNLRSKFNFSFSLVITSHVSCKLCICMS